MKFICFIGRILLIAGISLLCFFHYDSITTCEILIALGIAFIFFEKITELNIFGVMFKLEGKLNEAEELRNAIEKIRLNLLTYQVITDLTSSSGSITMLCQNKQEFDTRIEPALKERSDLLKRGADEKVIAKLSMELVMQLMSLLKYDANYYPTKELGKLIREASEFKAFIKKTNEIIDKKEYSTGTIIPEIDSQSLIENYIRPLLEKQ